MIGIINYGVGNLGSVANAFTYLGIDATIIDDPNEIGKYDRLILPGVGSFSIAMHNLKTTGWADAIRAQVKDGIPLLGICLGMQLLFDLGEEHGQTVGLGFIEGKVGSLSTSLAIPHMGWNGLAYSRQHRLFDGVKEHVDFYFVHSFQCIPTIESSVIAICDYGDGFAAAVGKDNVVGVQFHPEKSQDVGLKILENFSEWDGLC
jgi:imidazole glycerol-phosphate synthase subunit HisH